MSEVLDLDEVRDTLEHCTKYDRHKLGIFLREDLEQFSEGDTLLRRALSDNQFVYVFGDVEDLNSALRQLERISVCDDPDRFRSAVETIVRHLTGRYLPISRYPL